MTGWPWPLDGVQGFFEGLTNVITLALSPVIQGVIDTLRPVVEGVSTAVWNALPPFIQDAMLFVSELAGQAWASLWAFIRDPIGSIQAGLDWIVSSIGVGIAGLSAAVGDVVAGVWTALPEWIRGAFEFVKDLAGQAWAGLWNFVKDPIGSIQNGLNWVVDSASAAIGGAVAGITGLIGDLLKGMADALGAAMQGVVTFVTTTVPTVLGAVAQIVSDVVIDPILGAVGWVFTRLSDIVTSMFNQIQGLFTHHSPIRPEEALGIGIPALLIAVVGGGLATTLVDLASTKVLATGLDLRALGGFIRDAINPSMFMGAVVGVMIGVGVKSPLTQFYRRLFRPEVPPIRDAQIMLWRGSIDHDQFRDVVGRWGYGQPFEDGYVELTEQLPGPGDLIRFVVREVIDPGVFDVYMSMQGFSLEVSEWYWQAHWILPARREIIDAFHRGLLSVAERDLFMVLHDFTPNSRPGISISDQEIVAGIAKTLIPRVDLRRGYRIGALDLSELEKRYGWLGYEEDAPLMTDIQVRLAFEAERNKLRDNAKADLVKGYITEATLRADLYALDYSPEAVDFFVADALADRARKQKDQLLDLYEDGYVKDLITDEDLKTNAEPLIVDPDALQLFLERAFVRKYSKTKVVSGD